MECLQNSKLSGRKKQFPVYCVYIICILSGQVRNT